MPLDEERSPPPRKISEVIINLERIMLSGLNKELLNLNDRIMKYSQIGNQLLRRNVHELQNKFVSLELQKTYLSSAEDEII